MLMILVPEFPLRPRLRYQSAPFRRIGGTAASVFHVVDDGGAIAVAVGDREWRAVAGEGMFSFQRVEQRAFFAANVGAGAAPQAEVETKVFPANSIAQVAGGGRLVNGLLKTVECLRIFVAEIEKALCRARCIGGDQHSPQSRREDRSQERPGL